MAPKGNKNAVGNKGGAPRTTSLQPEEMIALGEEMCAWVAIHKPLHLCVWYSFEKNITDSQWNTYIDRPEFTPYYEKALKLVGMQYLDKTSNVRDGISQRWQRVYFKDLRKQEDEDLDKAAERAKGVQKEGAVNLASLLKDGTISQKLDE